MCIAGATTPMGSSATARRSRARRRCGWCRERGLALALRTERRRPQIDRVRRDELLAARHARLAAAAVHLELELEPAFLARSGAVVTHGRAGGLHGPLEHAGYRG